MNIVCIGGGPAGLYVGILMKLADPRHRVRVFERNQPDDTFGFGVVFSDATLGTLGQADPVSQQRIFASFAHWDDIEIHHGGQVQTSTGHGFCGIERRHLLAIMQQRAAELGVEICYEQTVTANEFADVDVIVAADGVASATRSEFAAQFGPSVDMRPNKFVWLGTTVPYRAFTFIFKPTEFGLFRVHAYRYAAQGSTFIVECTEATWRQAGLDQTDEAGTIAILERIFAEELGPHRLIKNRSIWRNFPAITNRCWSARNQHGVPVVLLGDAVHTAHFSIGSGTKLAMEDAIALADALTKHENMPQALAMYEAARRPVVESLQAAAQISLEWFEGTERYMRMSPAQFAYSLMTRSGRVSHDSMRKRDPQLVAAVEAELSPGVAGPHATAWRHGSLAFNSRLIGWRVAPGATLAASKRLPYQGPFAGAIVEADGQLWLEDSHGQRMAVTESQGAGPAVLIADQPATRAAAIAKAKQAIARGATLILATAQQSGATARIAAAALADQLRNELQVAVALVADGASLPDLDAALAAGRADLVIVRYSDQ